MLKRLVGSDFGRLSSSPRRFFGTFSIELSSSPERTVEVYKDVTGISRCREDGCSQWLDMLFSRVTRIFCNHDPVTNARDNC